MTDSRPGLDQTELATTGQTNFWINGEHHALVSEADGRWMLYGNFRPGRATPIATIDTDAEGWRWISVNGAGHGGPFADWRAAVRAALRD